MRTSAEVLPNLLTMKNLTKEERERVNDTKHSIQAATEALSRFDRAKIPHVDQIEDCLDDAGKTLQGVLKGGGTKS